MTDSKAEDRWIKVAGKKRGADVVFFFNPATKKTSWFEPLPQLPGDADDSITDSAERSLRRRTNDISSHFPTAPSHTEEEALANLDLLEPDGPVEEENGDEEKLEVPEKLTALQLTWDATKVKYLDDKDGVLGLRSRCAALGIKVKNGNTNAKRAVLERLVIDHFRKLHVAEKSDYLQSECFVLETQVVDRPRQPTLASKKKAAREAALVQDGAQQRPAGAKPSKKANQPISEILAKKKYSSCFFEVRSTDGKQSTLRCKCLATINARNWSALDDHKKTKKHMDFEAKEEAQKLQQVRLRVAAGISGDEVLLEGQRRSSVNEDEKEFRCGLVEQFIAAGIPLEKLDLLRPFLETHTNKSLSAVSNMKREYISPLLEKEVHLQMEEVKGKVVSIIADATPRQGDVFALIVRFVAISPVDHLPVVQQRLISVQFLDGNLDAGNTAAGPV